MAFTDNISYLEICSIQHFDRHFWTTEFPNYIQEFIQKYTQKHKELELIIKDSNPSNHWNLYFKYLLTKNNDFLIQAADLGNPYAMFDLSGSNDMKIREIYLDKAAKTGHPESILRYIELSYLRPFVYGSSKEHTIEEKDKIRDRVLKDFEGLPHGLLDLPTEENVIYCEVEEIYGLLNTLYEDGRYTDEILFYAMCAGKLSKSYKLINYIPQIKAVMSMNLYRKKKDRKVKRGDRKTETNQRNGF